MKPNTPVLSAILLLFSISVFSQCTATNSDSKEGIFWEISGNGLQKPSYLLGTLHRASAKSIIDSIPSIIVMLGSVEQVCPEVDLTQMPVLKKNTEKTVEKKSKTFLKPWPSDSTYKNLLTSEQMQTLLASISSEYPESYLEVFRPIELLGFIQRHQDKKYIDLSKIKNDSIRRKAFIAYSDSIMILDELLLNVAKRNKTDIVPLDADNTRKEILAQINTSLPEVSYKQEMESLMFYVVNRERIDSLKLVSEENLLQAYLNQDFNYLCSYTENHSGVNDFLNVMNWESEEIEFVLSLLVDKRNNLWMEKIPTLINEKSTFIAVGASHLCGENGLINQLRKKGYKVKPIWK